jgi:hypothetical protein
LVGKPEGKRPLGMPKRIWQDNIKVSVKDAGLEGVDEIHLAQDGGQWWALVNTGVNLRVA